MHAAKIKLGLTNEIYLGNLDAKRDWGHAREYVKAMWLMLQQDRPSDYVIATGQSHSVRDFLNTAFSHVGLNYRDYIKSKPELIRPTDIQILVGDSSKAKRELDWKYNVSFTELVQEMVDADLQLIKETLKSNNH
jgi:GDPmannose 4,6-dehydratase